MEAREAVEQAINARNSYIGERESTRVEEVEPMNHGWNIVLSWLERDEAGEAAKEGPSLFDRAFDHYRLSAKTPGILMERIYRKFEVREHEPNPRMSVVEWNR